MLLITAHLHDSQNKVETKEKIKVGLFSGYLSQSFGLCILNKQVKDANQFITTDLPKLYRRNRLKFSALSHM